jgi:hypothetical protein
VHLGVPLYCLPLTSDVCAAASEAAFLSDSACQAHRQAQRQLDLALQQLVAAHGGQDGCRAAAAAAAAASGRGLEGGGGGGGMSDAAGAAVVELPSANLLFDGSLLQAVDLGDCTQSDGCVIWA